MVRCQPSAEARCQRGDLWLLDSCGEPEEKLEECENRACREDACEPPPTEPCLEPEGGRCDGDVVRLCLAGRPLRVDCAAQGLRCAIGSEGAECQPPVPLAEQCEGIARCDGDVLVRCEAGRRQRTDCKALRAECLTLADTEQPACVAVQSTGATPGCGPCGCPPAPHAREHKCDGRDEEGDGLVDEGLACGPVPLLAFIATDARGQSTHAREDVEREVERLNRVFADGEGDGELSFVLEQVTFLPDAELLALDMDEFGRLASDLRLHPQRDELYVPLLFTDALVAGGGTPKLGVSTLPNGTCGSVQRGSGPEVGLVAVAKARSTTTLAHELGHFLGLCHTHEQQEAAPFTASRNAATGELESCEASCRGRGDGVCDTPFDPGPEACAYDSGCRSACGVAAEPDVQNLMSYYTYCRTAFSNEQRALMQHTVALRRGYQRCRAESCPCQLGGSECPVGMSCRPGSLPDGQRVSRCALDGPRAPGADCEFLDECGAGSLCLREASSGARRCVRPCLSSTEGCTCVAAGDGLSICREDLPTP